MIEYSTGDIFSCSAPVLVCPVNTVGTMGGGLAKQFKRRFPWCVGPYAKACKHHQFNIGMILEIESPMSAGTFRILHIATKVHWRDPSELSYVVAGSKALLRWINKNSIGPVAVPALGCGLGGLWWGDVRSVMESELKYARKNVIIFEPKE